MGTNLTYEREKFRPYHEIIATFARALSESADELLSLSYPKEPKHKLTIVVLIQHIKS